MKIVKTDSVIETLLQEVEQFMIDKGVSLSTNNNQIRVHFKDYKGSFLIADPELDYDYPTEFPREFDSERLTCSE